MRRVVVLLLLVILLTVSCLESPVSPLVISPDGNTLIYHTPTDRGGLGPSKLLSYDLTTGKEQVLYESDGAIRGPALSPDGSKVAFFVLSPQPERHRGGPFAMELLLLDLSSSDVEHLARESAVADSNVVSWSPDGGCLVYGVFPNPGARASHAPESEIWLMDLSTRERRLLTSGELQGLSPQFSPDGKKIACFLAGPTYLARGRVKMELTGFYRGHPSVRWWMLSTIDLDTGEAALLAPALTDYRFYTDHFKPQWSHSGRHIAYFVTCGNEAQTSEVLVYGLARGTQKRVSPRSGQEWPGVVAGVSWSADDSRLAFYRQLEPADSHASRIEVVDAKAGHFMSVVDDHFPNYLPRWSPVDNDRLYFYTFFGERPDVQCFLRGLDVSTGKVSLVRLKPGESDEFARLSADHRRTYARRVISHQEARVFRQRLEGLDDWQAMQEIGRLQDAPLLRTPEVLDYALLRLRRCATATTSRDHRLWANHMIGYLQSSGLPDEAIKAWEAVAQERDLEKPELLRLASLYFGQMMRSWKQADFEGVVSYEKRSQDLGYTRSTGFYFALLVEQRRRFVAYAYLGLGRVGEARELLEELAADPISSEGDEARELLEKLDLLE